MASPRHLSSAMLLEILTRAEQEERDALSKALHEGSTKSLGPSELQEQVCAAGGHAVGNFFRGGEGISYAELLVDAADHLKVEKIKSRYSKIHGDLCLAELDMLSAESAKKVHPDLRIKLVDAYVDELERKILSKLMVVAYERATPAQRAVVDAKLADLAKTPEGKSISGMSTTAALLVVGRFSARSHWARLDLAPTR